MEVLLAYHLYITSVRDQMFRALKVACGYLQGYVLQRERGGGWEVVETKSVHCMTLSTECYRTCL